MSKQYPEQKGPGLKYRPTSVDVGASKAKIPSKTIKTSPNSHKRGPQGNG